MKTLDTKGPLTLALSRNEIYPEADGYCAVWRLYDGRREVRSGRIYDRPASGLFSESGCSIMITLLAGDEIYIDCKTGRQSGTGIHSPKPCPSSYDWPGITTYNS